MENPESEEILNRCEYIGDGVYIEIEYGSIWLYTSNGINITNTIALDSEVYRNFTEYIKRRLNGK